MTTKTYQGSCCCGAVRFEADLDLDQGASRCNCTVCTKTGVIGTVVKPGAVRVTAGEEHLSSWSRYPIARARFCSLCGLRLYGEGELAELGGAFMSVNLNTLDGVSLEGLTIRYLDGLHDTWAVLAEAPHATPFARSA